MSTTYRAVRLSPEGLTVVLGSVDGWFRFSAEKSEGSGNDYFETGRCWFMMPSIAWLMEGAIYGMHRFPVAFYESEADAYTQCMMSERRLRYSKPKEVREISNALDGLDAEWIETQVAVWGGSWPSDASLEWLAHLQSFYSAAARSGDAVVYYQY